MNLKGWLDEARKAEAASETTGYQGEEETEPEKETDTKMVATGEDMDIEAADRMETAVAEMTN